LRLKHGVECLDRKHLRRSGKRLRRWPPNCVPRSKPMGGK
jgi:hypothetical protein